jgi:FkbM family methyltransferase
LATPSWRENAQRLFEASTATLRAVPRGQSGLSFIKRLNPRPTIKRVAFYGEFLPQTALCFDIGANLGQKAEVFLACGARVILVEPNSLCLPTLKFHFAKNPKAEIVTQAVGSAEQMTNLYVHGTDARASVHEDWASGLGRTKILTVPVTTLDALINRFGAPHFIKIDVEGFEVEVLQGLSRPVPLLSFEYRPTDIDRLQRCLMETSKFGKMIIRATDMNCNWITPKTDNIEKCLIAIENDNPWLYGDMFVWLAV